MCFYCSGRFGRIKEIFKKAHKSKDCPPEIVGYFYFMKKTQKLIEKFGKENANKVCDLIITELQIYWNQDRIDFYLDVKNLLK